MILFDGVPVCKMATVPFSASAKGKKNPLYCFCDKMETMDMIG